MMYPRLYLARNLLREDGVIFVSIDDHEVENLMRLTNEIFGEENFVALFVWEKRTTRENRRVFSFNHEYVLCVARNKPTFEESRNLLPLTEDVKARYNNPDNDARGPWQSVSLNAQAGHATKSQFYTVTCPGGRTLDPPPGRCWALTEPRMKELIADNRVWFGEDGNNVPRRKVFFSEAADGLTPQTLWSAQDVGTNDSAKKALLDLFDGKAVFETPKPTGLVARMLELATGDDDIVLDFFAGSGTTAHAVLDLNGRDGGRRQFILTQLPEPTEQPEYPTIADITKDRVRRAAKTLDDADGTTAGLFGDEKGKTDRGFRVFKLAESNFNTWDATASGDDKALTQQLELHVDHIRPGRSDDDLLFEILMKSGYPLTTSVESITVEGKRVFAVGGGALLVCLDRDLTLQLMRALAARKPSRVVCLDAGFADNDQLKANAVQTFKTGGVVFKTV